MEARVKIGISDGGQNLMGPSCLSCIMEIVRTEEGVRIGTIWWRSAPDGAPSGRNGGIEMLRQALVFGGPGQILYVDAARLGIILAAFLLQLHCRYLPGLTVDVLLDLQETDFQIVDWFSSQKATHRWAHSN
jgi:hypothetical protein